MRISDWSSDVCSSDLIQAVLANVEEEGRQIVVREIGDRADIAVELEPVRRIAQFRVQLGQEMQHVALKLGHLVYIETLRSEEHTSELQSLMRNSYAVFCLKKKTTNKTKAPQSKFQSSLKYTND